MLVQWENQKTYHFFPINPLRIRFVVLAKQYWFWRRTFPCGLRKDETGLDVRARKYLLGTERDARQVFSVTPAMLGMIWFSTSLWRVAWQELLRLHSSAQWSWCHFEADSFSMECIDIPWADKHEMFKVNSIIVFCEERENRRSDDCHCYTKDFFEDQVERTMFSRE